jgi:hypothetical protein
MTTMRCSPSPSPRRRSARLVLPALALALLMAFLVPTSASAAGGDAGDYVARINSLRASVGVAPLQVNGELAAAAQGWADHMAATGTLAHSPDIASGLSVQWSKIGENVGTGPSNAVIWPAFVASAHHYANIVDPAFNYVGVGVAYSGGRQWTCHRFMQLQGGGSPAPAPKPAPTVAPTPPKATAPSAPAAPRPTTTTSTVPAPPPAPPVPAPSPSGPPPPADSTRVATVLSALRHLST